MSDPVQSVTVALWGTELGDAQKTAQRALDAVPDGWAKIAGKWIRVVDVAGVVRIVEPRRITAPDASPQAEALAQTIRERMIAEGTWGK